jgi:hydroxyacylglutathione hydrolase
MYETLEDEFGDVVGKARRGQEKAVAILAEALGIDASDWESMEGYQWTPEAETIAQVAVALGLDTDKLKTSAAALYFPQNPTGQNAAGANVHMMVLGSSFLMNGYVAGCTKTGKALCIDPGFDAETILATAKNAGLEIEKIVLTHGHHDHVGALEEVVKATRASVYMSAGDRGLVGDLSRLIMGELCAGEIIGVGQINFTIQATPGHTPGGMSLLGEGIAFVGDALFAGSLGGTRSLANYDLQRRAVREQILSLPDATILYPGHGPATTVGEEKANNPFFDL